MLCKSTCATVTQADVARLRDSYEPLAASKQAGRGKPFAESRVFSLLFRGGCLSRGVCQACLGSAIPFPVQIAARRGIIKSGL